MLVINYLIYTILSYLLYVNLILLVFCDDILNAVSTGGLFSVVKTVYKILTVPSGVLED